ncbi:MAG TPA: DUF4097 family beta strand repeat-containing protein [Gemmatimonadales bacterium]|nr:DUF4097 family beta strand repeat-containing protein [Gemmatimonadales bacterium]
MLLVLAAALGLTIAPPQDTDTSFAVRQGQRLELSDFGGQVTIKAWRQNSIRVKAMHSSHDRISVSNEGSVVSISASSRHGPATIDYELLVPPWMPLSVSGTPSAEVSIEGTEAEVTVETVEGSVHVVGGSGNVSLRSVEGEVSIEGARGHIELNSVDGAISIKDCSGDITAETVDGEITMSGIESANVDASTVDGSVQYDGTIRDNGRYHFESHDGDVTVSVPEKSNVTVSVSTFSGDFDSCFPLQLKDKTKHRFTFVLGTGSARLEMESFDGSISICRPGRIHDKSEE